MHHERGGRNARARDACRKRAHAAARELRLALAAGEGRLPAGVQPRLVIRPAVQIGIGKPLERAEIALAEIMAG